MSQLRDVQKKLRAEQGGLSTKLLDGTDIALSRKKSFELRARRNNLHFPCSQPVVDLVAEDSGSFNDSCASGTAIPETAYEEKNKSTINRVKTRAIERAMSSTTTPTTKKKCKSLFKKLVRNDHVAVEAVRLCPPNISSEEWLDAAMEMCEVDDDDN
jgi:hypothetical protein